MPERRPPAFFEPLRPRKGDSKRTKRIAAAVNEFYARRNDTLERAEAMLANAPSTDALEKLLARPMPIGGYVQPELFPELTKQAAPAKPRPPKLYPKARAREAQVLKMTCAGKRVREIAVALGITEKSVYEIRARLRKAGRLVTPARITGKSRVKK